MLLSTTGYDNDCGSGYVGFTAMVASSFSCAACAEAAPGSVGNVLRFFGQLNVLFRMISFIFIFRKGKYSAGIMHSAAGCDVARQNASQGKSVFVTFFAKKVRTN